MISDPTKTSGYNRNNKPSLQTSLSEICKSMDLKGEHNATDRMVDTLFASSCPYSSEELNCPATSTQEVDRFKWSYLHSEITSKLSRPGIPEKVRKDAAIAKLIESEESCRMINQHGYHRSTPSFFFESVLARAQLIIANVMGPCNPASMFESARFTSGATTSRRRKNGDAYFKYHPTWAIDVSRSANRYVIATMKATPPWTKFHNMKFTDKYTNVLPRIVLGNQVTTVPKKTDIDRAIAMEPDGNAMLQTSVGTYLKSRLMKIVNVNLRDQSINQEFAKFGSATGIISTLDLASASDSISDRLVWDLLPPEWYNLLNDLRSRYGVMPDGSVIKWEKFSAMGNGFTFELESLLFYAISRAVAELNDCSPEFVNIYGDDIIVPTRCARNLVTVLADLGFKTNEDKSFITGIAFRESCGKHYFKGCDVTPFYVKTPVSQLPRYVWFLNSLRAWAYSESSDICCPSVEDYWFAFRRSFVPKILLGGTQINSITSVYSAGEPRKKIKFEVEDRLKLHGRRALLRWFQNNQCSSPHVESLLVRTQILGARADYESRSADYSRASVRSITRKGQKDLPSELITTNNVVATLVKNLDQPDPYTSSRYFIFPKEVK